MAITDFPPPAPLIGYTMYFNQEKSEWVFVKNEPVEREIGCWFCKYCFEKPHCSVCMRKN
jgi:hypothetical protein